MSNDEIIALPPPIMINSREDPENLWNDAPQAHPQQEAYDDNDGDNNN